MVIKECTQLTQAHYDLLFLADPSIDVIKGYINRCLLFEYTQKNELVAVLGLLPTRPGTIEIVNIAVAEIEQGKGIGQQLIQFAIQQAEKMNYTTIEIGTGSTSFAQLYLYQKCGFRLSSIDHDFFLTHYTQEIIENGLLLKDMIRLRLDLHVVT